MPTTPAGTTYFVSSAMLPIHGDCYWGVADAHAADSRIPTILYAHGATGAGNQFATLAAWTQLRNWLMDHGWAWIEGAGGGGSSWGNDAAQAAYPAYLDHVASILDIGPKVLIGRSMGGLVTAWLYAQSALKNEFVGWINNSGVSTLFVGNTSGADNDLNSASYFTAMPAAYGVSTYADLQAAAADHAPESWPPSVWSGKNILCCYGDADTTVPFTPRGAGPLRAIWAGQPTVDLVSVRTGGDHSGTNGSYLDVAAMTQFLTTVTGGETEPPPDPGSYLRVVGSYLYSDGRRYAYGPRPV